MIRAAASTSKVLIGLHKCETSQRLPFKISCFSISSVGVGHDPLLVVDDYEDGGIRLKCLSERLFSEAQLLWTDSRGDNITGTPLSADTGTAGVSSSIILKAGSGNSMSCRILDKQLKTSTESSVAIAGRYELPVCSELMHADQIAPGARIYSGTE